MRLSPRFLNAACAALFIAMSLVHSHAETISNMKPVFEEPTVDDAQDGESWKERWFLDGTGGTVTRTPRGLELRAGSEPGEAGGHMVLWTKQEFTGDLELSFRYTRLDEATQFVNIVYLYATGIGEAPYVEDIAQWSDLRRVAKMKTYYENMKLLHLSFAAYGAKGDVQYIRARRYPTLVRDDFPRFDKETAITPDYPPEGFFQPGLEHLIIINKDGDRLSMFVEAEDKSMTCVWRDARIAEMDHGRIGLRLMATRAARFADFKVSKRR